MAKIRILVVDDHPMIRTGVHSLLENEPDFEVIGESTDGEQAVSMTRELKPDIVVMDIVMPKMNGIEATRYIKSETPSINVLILSAYNDISYILEALENGASGYVLKDSSGNELVSAIRAARSGDSVLDPRVTKKLLERVLERPHAASPAAQSPVPLTPREVEILALASKGLSNKDIANQLTLSLRTVKAHLTNIFSKMGCGSRTDAIIKGLKAGYITLEEEQKTESSGLPSGS
jgi:two-component system, NarL family, response regulator LiaR